MERILLPIATAGDIHGGFGTVWVNDVFIFNDSDEQVLFRKPGCILLIPECGDVQNVEAHGWTRPFVPGGASGAFIHVPAADAPSLHFGGTLRELSRAEESPGTQLPVVREADFARRIILVHMRLERNVRALLRVYGFDHLPVDARVRVYDLESADAVVDTGLTLVPGMVSPGDGLPEYPSYYQVDLLATYPVLAAATAIRIEIDALSADAKLWAMGSITNNITQQLTIVTPQ